MPKSPDKFAEIERERKKNRRRSLRPHSRAAAVTCGRGRCKLPAMSRLNCNRQRLAILSLPAKRKTLRFLQRNGCLSGPLNRLNAILSLLQPLDRCRTPSAIGSAIGRPLSRPISHPRTGGSPQPPRSKPLKGLKRARVVL